MNAASLLCSPLDKSIFLFDKKFLKPVKFCRKVDLFPLVLHLEEGQLERVFPGRGHADPVEPGHEDAQLQPQDLPQRGARVGGDVEPDDLAHLVPVPLADARVAQASDDRNVFL